MMELNLTLEDQMRAYCSQIGQDNKLVQGAGGNASWKDKDILWVKASGTWLSQADFRDIFVPVDLNFLSSEIDRNNFSINPSSLINSSLKPSIETLLHALMPHQFVVHLHPVEILAHLVCDDVEKVLRDRLEDSLAWALVDYFKPGSELAKNIQSVLLRSPGIQVIFLKNHGVVIGAPSISGLEEITNYLLDRLGRSEPRILNSSYKMPNDSIDSYMPILVPKLHLLSLEESLFRRLKDDWALYPDHIVFLGEKAYAFTSIDEFRRKSITFRDMPDLIFIKDIGTFVSPRFSLAQLVQLECYMDVIARLPAEKKVCCLNKIQIAQLLNWDAESYRLSVAPK